MGRRATGADVGSTSLLSIPVRASGGGVRVLAGLRLRALDGTARLDSDLVSEATGGPLLDRRGRPVGMALVAGPVERRSTAVALPWTAIQTRLKRLRPGPRSVYVRLALSISLRTAAACVRRRRSPGVRSPRRPALPASVRVAASRHRGPRPLMSGSGEARSRRLAAQGERPWT